MDVRDGPLRVSSRRATACVIATAALALLVLFGEAARAGTSSESPRTARLGLLDQTSLPADFLVESYVTEEYQDAQTFTAGRSGFLDSVALSLKTFGSDRHYSVSLMPTSGGGVPTGAPLASSRLDGCRVQSQASPIEMRFGPAAAITAGTRYAIVVADASPPNNSGRHPVLRWGSANAYANGDAYYAPAEPNPTWTRSSHPDFGFFDFGFSTYVSESQPPALRHAATQTTVTPSRDPAPPGLVTFTASVVDSGNPASVPTGWVLFGVDGSPSDPVTEPLDAEGHASSSIDLRGVATSTISATYCPDGGDFVGSAGTAKVSIVQNGTTTTVAASPAAVSVGQSTTLTATVAADDPGKTPTGSVQFSFDGHTLGGPVALVSGSATLVTSALPAGGRYIEAAYSPADGFFRPSSANGQVEVDRWPSTTAVDVQPAETVAGEPATFAARVAGSSSDGHHPTGTVQFSEDFGAPIGAPVAIDATGTATLVAYGGAGDYEVRARYGGDDYFDNSEGSVDQTILRADTATAITSSPNPVAAGADLTIGVDVRVLEPGDVDPDGAVQLLADGEPIDDPIYLEGYPGFDVTLTAPSTPLTSTITAQYLGGPDTNPSSASLTQTVIASISLAPPPPAPPPAAPVPPPSPPATPPTAAKSLATMVDGLRKTLRSRGIRALNGLSESFAAPAAGRVTQQIYSPTDPRAGSSSKLLATGATRLATARTAKLKLKLTAAGRRALRRAGTVKLAVISRFTPATGPVTRRTDRISARGTRRSRRVVARRSTSGGAFAWPAPSPVLAGEQRPLIEQPWRIVSRAEPKR
jgi:Bacterial Ig-like domain (group 3)